MPRPGFKGDFLVDKEHAEYSDRIAQAMVRASYRKDKIQTY